MKANTEPWAPYEPTPDDPWDLRKVAHLHRRAGFGATWAELQRDLKAGPAASIDRLLHPEPEPASFHQVATALQRAAEGAGRDYSTEPRDIGTGWLYRMAFGPDPLGEKLTLFWHNHFATGLHGVYRLKMMTAQNELFRTHARGNFADLLRRVESDPAMLVWLNGGENEKDRPNENFARELLELFTLGVGHYTEQDVREAARALTGWRRGRDDILNETDSFTYEERLADTGTKTILGQTGPWRCADLLRIILEQPAAADHLCRRLYRGLVSEDGDPSDELIRPLASEFRASNYSIEHVVGIVLRSRHFFSPAAYRMRVKSPVEFCVGVIRELAPARTANLLTRTAISCEQQGQVLFDPPSVKGWDGGIAWLNSATMLARMNWIVDLLGGNPSTSVPPYDARPWAQDNGIDADKMLDSYCSLLLQGDLNPATRALAARLWSEGSTPPFSAALQVLLQSPEYHLA
ncbi:MAG TPA: DUF1800 domain-containing protein [Pirellulales bacterium]|nr:DUF1800 domain-containing protein [Pirellulales bacterium]